VTSSYSGPANGGAPLSFTVGGSTKTTNAMDEMSLYVEYVEEIVEDGLNNQTHTVASADAPTTATSASEVFYLSDETAGEYTFNGLSKTDDTIALDAEGALSNGLPNGYGVESKGGASVYGKTDAIADIDQMFNGDIVSDGSEITFAFIEATSEETSVSTYIAWDLDKNGSYDATKDLMIISDTAVYPNILDHIYTIDMFVYDYTSL